MQRSALVSFLVVTFLSACSPTLGVRDAGDARNEAPARDAGGPRLDAGTPPIDAGAPISDAGGNLVDAAPQSSDGGHGGDDAGEVFPDAGPPSAEATAYWQDTGAGLVGQALVEALHAKLSSTHEQVSYANVLAAFETTDDDRAGCAGIFDFYSTRCWSSSEACGNYDSEGDCFNREHSWPKSWWGSSESLPAYSDLFHVLPADGYVNNQRANLPLGDVASTIYTSTNGSRVGACAASEALGSSCFEPTDELKGDLARIYFYMAVRYEGELACCDQIAVEGADLKGWSEALLRQWHVEDPVDEDERARNEAVFALQSNRNPFVDFPSWLSRIDDF